ncbi:hypothetical protein NXC12_CH00509 [Rhizobium etli]|uniref:Uncharacterized protein n=1 Tax=Rhizobium etli TaxID=29449 RepID=A0AAN1BC52_RHIET|nr:hypothetical protein [Rhizobium etli]ARQ08600.1 hypothetical protein NXC12_CH00509 [Rhizobium etli]
MKSKSHFVGAMDINGHPVSFFTTPHSEPDFLWLDIEELTQAVTVDQRAAQRLFEFARGIPFLKRPMAMTAHNGRLVAIGSGKLAQSLCACIDANNGYKGADPESWNAGPLTLKCIVAIADAQEAFAPLSFAGIAQAFKQQEVGHE